MSDTVYFLQDGASFYLYSDKACEWPIKVVSVDMMVSDGDITGAVMARLKFRRENPDAIPGQLYCQ